jgi:hypothetical protein
VFAPELRDELLDAAKDVKAKVLREDETTMDLGTTLYLILGTAAATAVAQGIASYLTRKGARIKIARKTKKDGSGELEILADGVAGDDLARIAQALQADS